MQKFQAAAPLQILVVDDEESIRYFLEKILTKAGYIPTIAHDAASARAIIAQHRFDIGIIDRMLPEGESGLDIIKALKHANSRCEVILISAYPSFDSARESMKYETFAYIPKPFTYQDMCRTVQQAEKKLLREKAAEEQLLAAGKLSELGVVSSHVAHEINNPLQIISGHAEILLQDASLNDRAKGSLKLIFEAARTIHRLNKNMRAILIGGTAEMAFLRPEAPLESARKFLTDAGAIKYCSVCAEYAQDAPCINGDHLQLQQVFMNLLLNAAQAMACSEQKELFLSTGYHPETGMVFVAIQDTGCGIPQEFMDKLFETFFTTRADQGGTGLGLPLVKKIVDKHAGTIAVQSQPGAGATFTVSFPAAVAREAGTSCRDMYSTTGCHHQ